MAKTHLDHSGTPGTFTRIGKLVPFLEVGIGQPFWAHGKVWVRVDYDAAAELTGTPRLEEGVRVRSSCCNFLIDPIDEKVEALTYG